MLQARNATLMQMSILFQTYSCSDDMEVAVVYYRHGFMPKHYKTDKDWQVRLDIERSKAIKCPTVNIQLAGTKKVCLHCIFIIERTGSG